MQRGDFRGVIRSCIVHRMRFRPIWVHHGGDELRGVRSGHLLGCLSGGIVVLELRGGQVSGEHRIVQLLQLRCRRLVHFTRGDIVQRMLRWVLLCQLWLVKLCELRGRDIRRGRKRVKFERGVCFLVRRGQVFGRGGELMCELQCRVLPAVYRPDFVRGLRRGKVRGIVGKHN